MCTCACLRMSGVSVCEHVCVHQSVCVCVHCVRMCVCMYMCMYVGSAGSVMVCTYNMTLVWHLLYARMYISHLSP